MNRNLFLASALMVSAACVLLCPPGRAAQRRAAAAPRADTRARMNLAAANFTALVAEYQRDHAAFHPTEVMLRDSAAPAGELERRNAAALAAEAVRLRGVIARIERTRTWLLPQRLQATWRALGAHARARLLELEERDVWQREPHRYPKLIAAGADRILRHLETAPEEKLRLFLLRSRETKRLLDEARLTLGAPPRIFTEAGSVEARRAAQFFRETVPQLFERAGGARMSAMQRAEFERANNRAADDLRLFAEWLERDLLPRSTGKVAIGDDALRRLLRVEEMIETPLDELARAGEAELRIVRDRMLVVAEEVAPGRGIASALDVLRRERSTPAGLVGDARLELDRVRVFLRTNNLFVIPEQLVFSVAEMPRYAGVRHLTATELADAPAGATAIRFLIAPPDADADRRVQDEHLAFFDRYALPFAAANAALPGALPLLPSRSAEASNRIAPGAVFSVSRAVADGWAQYCEQALLDAGFGGNNPKYELAQLHRRQVSLCRHLVALAIHRERMNYNEAIRFFEREGNLNRTLAARFALDAALDPLTLVASLGARVVNELRAEVRRKQGVAFDPRAFHEAVLVARSLPLPLLRASVVERAGGKTTFDATNAGSEAPDDRSDNARRDLDIEFTVLALGSASDYEGSRGVQLITDVREFARIWRTLGASRGSANPPDVNFETRSVILVRQGQKPTGGYSIAVRSVRQTEKGVVVYIEEQQPGSGDMTTQVLTSPFVVISVPRLNPNTLVRFAGERETTNTKGQRKKITPQRRSNAPIRRGGSANRSKRP